jgi:drug/metabolite transporter (DMT)-like permease
MPAAASTILLAIGSGIAFSMMALAYRWGETKQVRPQMVFWGVAALGAGVFAVRCVLRGEFEWLPFPVLFWAILGALGQYAAIILMQSAMRRGAFGPIWCALTLNFIPVTIFSLAVAGEKQSVGQWLAMVLAIGCVVVAAMDPGKSAMEKKDENPEEKGRFSILAYAVMLLTLMFTNGLLNVGMKHLKLPTSGGPYLPAHMNTFLFMMYITLFTAITIEWLLWRKNVPKLRVAAGPVVVAGVGSLLGVVCLITAGMGPNVIAFVVSSILSVLGGFIGAAVFFKDPLTRTSWTVIALGVASVASTAF